jgi:putative endonuclease
MPVKTPQWHVYMVRCRDGSLYTGIATDIARRFAEHQSGKGAKYLRGRIPLKMVYKKKIGSRSLAFKIERIIKRMPKEKKEGIVTKRIDVNLLPFTRKK